MIPLRNGDGEIVGYVEVQTFASLPEQNRDELRGFSVGDASDRLKEAGEAVALTCEAVMSQLRSSLGQLAPDEVELQFGLSLGGEVGIPVITKATTEATLSVTAKWTKASSGEPVVAPTPAQE
jgi:hypothetical protein